MTAVHMSVDFREAIANRLDQSQTTWSILWHLPRIKAATNDLVIQGRGGEFNVPMLVQSSCTCNTSSAGVSSTGQIWQIVQNVKAHACS